MKKLVKGLTAMLILGVALAMTSCGDDITRIRYHDYYHIFHVNPAADLSFEDLTYYGNGALFQRINRSIRFFGNGQFRSTGVGLNPGNATAIAVGNRWRLVSEDRANPIGWTGVIAIYQDPAAPAAPATTPAYNIHFTLARHVFVITDVVAVGAGLTGTGAPDGGIPTAANLPRGEGNPFNWGRIPNWVDDSDLLIHQP